MYRFFKRERERGCEHSLQFFFRCVAYFAEAGGCAALPCYFQLNLIGPHWFDGFLSRVIQHHLGYLNSFGNFRRGRSRRSGRTISDLRASRRSTRGNAVTLNKSCKGTSDNNSPINSGSSFDSEVCIYCI